MEIRLDVDLNNPNSIVDTLAGLKKLTHELLKRWERIQLKTGKEPPMGTVEMLNNRMGVTNISRKTHKGFKLKKYLESRH